MFSGDSRAASASGAFVILPFDPLEERGFVNQNTAADPAQAGFKTIAFCVEGQMAQSALRWPSMVTVPVGEGNEAGRCR